MRYFFKFLRITGIIGVILMLTACADFHDVDHRWCPPKSSEVESVQEIVNLKVDTLFSFDGAKFENIQPSGHEQLNSLVAQLINSYTKIDNIVVEGYTDRLGSEAYNQSLSQKRAETVKYYLQSKGINTSITAVGRGESKLAINCQNYNNMAQLIDCLQPDRRVVVRISGAKR
ncbi:OmpA family protein [Morganella morganii]|uniref:OmpA family protein n=1 Tax=Morganella morganii TaxID=582 RepID=UPI0006891C1E|nr:OmpA family protein [Morganella morganii]MDS0909444.1 OmpA family protein [Morganella morganii]HAU5618364.1 OmpA family protein [Morganella morganii]HCU2394272.1 OmpA family protein [Morganella morganii]HDQ2582811.1 OmpA family protein [Morganella morganii]HED1573588.1 OmpA family protein [Morganella morganii]